jgi:hypothetical protein
LGVQHELFAGSHVSGVVQPPQFSVPPQPSATVPQTPAGKSLHSFGVQHERACWLQLSGLAHVPQLSVPPQLSEYVPHVAPRSAQVVAWHPHWPCVPPPPHDSGSVQPQKSVPPQPLSMLPHWPGWHVCGMQHWSVALSQICAPVQKLQVTVPPQPSLSAPPHVMPA